MSTRTGILQNKLTELAISQDPISTFDAEKIRNDIEVTKLALSRHVQSLEKDNIQMQNNTKFYNLPTSPFESKQRENSGRIVNINEMFLT